MLSASEVGCSDPRGLAGICRFLLTSGCRKWCALAFIVSTVSCTGGRSVVSDVEEFVRADRHLVIPEADWSRAVRQAEVIRRLADCRDVPGRRGRVPRVVLVDEAAQELGVSRRQVYVLLRRWRAGSGRVTDLLPSAPTGGRGGSLLDARVESNSVMLRMWVATLPPGTLGVFVKQTGLPGSTHAATAYIRLDSAQIGALSYPGTWSDKIRGVYVHELGHGLNLADNPSTGRVSVMKYGAQGLAGGYYAPTPYDIEEVLRIN